VDGGVRAMAPPNTRYIQAFQYSSLIVGAWIWCAIRKRLAARPQSSGPAPGWRPLCHLSLVWALPLVLLSFSYVASARYLPPRYRESDGRRLFSVLKRLAQSSAEPVVIAGIERGLRIPQTFCCGSDVEWRPQ